MNSNSERKPWEVSTARIARMDENDLGNLMRDLLRAQAYKCGLPQGQIDVNTEEKAPDGGCDGWTGKPEIKYDWLGDTETCWQFKAGEAGEPAKIKKEVTKLIPSKTLRAGGRFVLVASGSTSGEKGVKDRKEALVEEAKKAGIPSERIEVIGSDCLTRWCNEHPAVAARWAGRPGGLWTFANWAESARTETHQTPWHPTNDTKSKLERSRAALNLNSIQFGHLHIHGPSGVGKTRFALELCREAEWRDFVIYFPQSTDSRVETLVDSVVAEEDVWLVLVVDNTQPDQAKELRESIGRASGRKGHIQLVTIGSDPFENALHKVKIEPLDQRAMLELIALHYPSLSIEQRHFVSRFSGGYVRLAQLAATYLEKNPGVTPQWLFERSEIGRFLSGMLGNDNRRPLHVVAALSHVGWSDQLQVEGKTIAEHFGLDWNETRYAVEQFQTRFEIVPRSGRYRVISPEPLGNFLAQEAWSIYPDLMESLYDALASDLVREAYSKRFKFVATHPRARTFAKRILEPLTRIEDFIAPRTAFQWTNLSYGAPELAARNIRQALTYSSLEYRLRIEEMVRTRIVWRLTELSWSTSTFDDAVVSLALLAEAENATYSNNSTGEFLGRFRIRLGATAVPYPNRFQVLDRLLEMKRPALTRLVIRALSKIGDLSDSRRGASHCEYENLEREWNPESFEEYRNCVMLALDRLIALTIRKTPETQDELVEASISVRIHLQKSVLREKVCEFYKAVRTFHPDTRESVRRVIGDYAGKARHRWKKRFTEEDLQYLDSFHKSFEDPSLRGRLIQSIGDRLEPEDEKLLDFRPLAKELLESPEVLEDLWPWLTSPKAIHAGHFGFVIAEVDTEEALADVLPNLTDAGDNWQIMRDYVYQKRKDKGDGWYQQWKASRTQSFRDRFLSKCLFGDHQDEAREIADAIRNGKADDQTIREWAISGLHKNPSVESFENLLRAMIETGHEEDALIALSSRKGWHSDESDHWRSTALDLVTNAKVIRSGDWQVQYQWEMMAKQLLGDSAKEIAAAIFKEHSRRESNFRFLSKRTPATKVLEGCVDADPEGVWGVLSPYLNGSYTETYRFSTGFPRGILDRMPHEKVLEWIAKDPSQVARVVGRMISNDLSSDETLVARVLEVHGDDENLGRKFLDSCFLDLGGYGTLSPKYEEVARMLEKVGERTQLPTLRRWTQRWIPKVREWAEMERQHEDEWEIHY